MTGRSRVLRPRVRAAVVPFPRPTVGTHLARPSRRSLAVGLALAVAAGCAYLAARETSLFAIGRIEIVGGPPAVRAQVRAELASLQGTSLVSLDGGALVRRVESLPSVVSASYDRSFPHTLRVEVVPERPAAILHRGPETWLVSARGRVVARVPNLTHPDLARIWVPRATGVTAGAFLADDDGGVAARALALTRRFPARIDLASFRHGMLVFRLRSGLELRLGQANDLRLKLAIARRALPVLPPGTEYLDVSVPGRPASGVNPQLSGGG